MKKIADDSFKLMEMAESSPKKVGNTVEEITRSEQFLLFP